ncbi:S1C family serine protease [Luteolibacter flavescens]|uniref:S1C family serine protease n=1 Tax=Luteolibacter flavescens TaxID=1859460 RepID=A0ABT3FUC5_9BACT|nr:S1C family serine protease [Luteolibacter flavescens]MCW1887187.1 S1C family serine protease [Luteolibacter flavescens]
MNARSIAAVLLLATGMASAAQTLETAYRTNGQSVQSAFDSVRAVLQDSSAVIQRGRKEIAYGTVMSADGYILTKASEIGDASDLSIIVGKKAYPEPQLISTDPTWDVALLKIPAEGLTPVRLLLDQAEPPRGTWVVANGATSRSLRRVQVGIIAANAREIPHAGGPVLGVSFEEKDKKLVVTEVAEKSGSATAGVTKDDVLLLLDGDEITGTEGLAELIGEYHVGDEVTLTIERAGEKKELKVELKGRSDVFGEEVTRNDMMSGAFSKRRSGFPKVIQHDIIANASSIGGPVLNLDGGCLGMNIARATRCETFAIPASELKSIAERLMSQAK